MARGPPRNDLLTASTHPRLMDGLGPACLVRAFGSRWGGLRLRCHMRDCCGRAAGMTEWARVLWPCLQLEAACCGYGLDAGIVRRLEAVA